MSSTSSSHRKLVVVGAGPIGCLAAMAFAKRGWRVELYEGRPDMRLPSSKAAAQQRSINLAISHRGIAALEAVEPALATRFLQSAIPMRGRMIHKQTEELDSQLYDRHGQCINSIDRALFGEALLNEAADSSNIRVFFNCKVVAADFDKKTMAVQETVSKKDFSVDFDLCIGADGSYSVIRQQMMRALRMNYQQEYIRDEYLELRIPAGKDHIGEPKYLLDPNHLHIWPRHSFMLIALPNKDKSFTCTLFAPTAELDRLCSADIILTWFNLYFPDALRAIGEKRLVDDFMKNPRSPLICTKVEPYHYRDRAILLGDAAHSMVPFYGQGLNCGLEDVRILTTLLDAKNVTSELPICNGDDRRLSDALQSYTDSRHEDLIAICDLAMDNYVEMRHSVTTLRYILRKFLDNLLYSLSSPRMVSLESLAPVLAKVPYPLGNSKGWLPLYTMVTFRPDISYAAAKRKAAGQAAVLTRIIWIGVATLGVAGTWLAQKLLINYPR